MQKLDIFHKIIFFNGEKVAFFYKKYTKIVELSDFGDELFRFFFFY